MQNYRRQNSLVNDAQDSMKVQFFICSRNLSLQASHLRLVVKLNQPGKPLRTVLNTKQKVFESNVDYDESLLIDYVFEVKQVLTFELYDQGNRIVASTTSSVGEIFGQREKRIIKPFMYNSEEKGKIIVRCEAVVSNTRFVEMSIQGLHLPDFTVFYFFGGTFPFIRIIKKRKTENFLVYESEVIQRSRNPKFKPFKLSERKLCDNDENMPIILQVLNFSQNGRHELIGEIEFSFSLLQQQNNFTLMKDQKPLNGKSKILFEKVDRTKRYAFTDFVMGGMEIQLITCVDYTGSNGIASRPQSLHYIGGNQKTAYESALQAVGNILLDYDTDKQIPIYGFGAKVKLPNFNTQGKVHQSFPLNGDMENPEVYHVEGMLQAYRECIPCLEFAGPTVLAPLLRENMSKARELKMNGNQYMILLILTDGDIMDEIEVYDLLIECSRLPLSIIIVGIGRGDFEIMERLDDDAMTMTSSTGVKTERDLVQFVPFRNFMNDGVTLAKEVLAELPNQVVEYHALSKIEPRPACSEGKNSIGSNKHMVYQ